jgi:elongation factor P
MLQRFLERRGRLLPTLEARLVHALLVELRGELIARTLYRIAKYGKLRLAQRLLLECFPLFDDLSALSRPNEIVKLCGTGLGARAILLALSGFAHLGAQPIIVDRALFGFRLDLVDTRVPRELERRESHDDEDDVGRRAVPGEAALVGLLPLGDRLDVGAERVGQVVRFDREPSRFNDLALDFTKFLVDLLNHGDALLARSRRRSNRGCVSVPRFMPHLPCWFAVARGNHRHLMASTTDIRKGLKIQIDGVPYHIVEHQFVKPGKGQSFTRCRVRNLTNGNVVERTWKSGDSVELADVEDRKMTYSWEEGDNFVFMDTNTGDQIYVGKDKVGEEARFLTEGLDIEVTLFNGNPIGIDMPANVVMQVVSSEPGVKGDTASGATKPATLVTGTTVNVPLFIKEGEWIKIDTSSGQYLERVNK